MYVDISTIRRNGKSYTRYLLRQSYREAGKVKHRTLANLSACSRAEIDAICLALRHKHDLTPLGAVQDQLSLHQGLSVPWARRVPGHWRYGKSSHGSLTRALGSPPCA